MNYLKRGLYKEYKIKKELEIEGYIVYKPTRLKFTKQKDIFGLFDLLAYHPVYKSLLFLQVSNGVKELISRKKKKLKEFKLKGVRIYLVDLRRKREISINKYKCIKIP